MGKMGTLSNKGIYPGEGSRKSGQPILFARPYSREPLNSVRRSAAGIKATLRPAILREKGLEKTWTPTKAATMSDSGCPQSFSVEAARIRSNLDRESDAAVLRQMLPFKLPYAIPKFPCPAFHDVLDRCG
jgi:hypothetical protein